MWHKDEWMGMDWYGTRKPEEIIHKLSPHKKKKNSLTLNKQNRRHLSLHLIGTRKMQAPKPYENYCLA